MPTRLICIFGLICLLACGQKPAMKSSVKEQRFVKRIKIGNTEAVAKMQPGQNAKGTGSDFIYFNVKFNNTDGSGFNKEKVLYLNFDMQKDFVLLNKGDSISPIFCQRIENGIKNSFEYIIAFEEKDAVDETVSLIYNDKIFSIGTIAFVYN